MSHHPIGDFQFHELEALAIFIEETGEALADVGKMLRHGKMATDGQGPMAMTYDNRAAVQKEVIDVFSAIMLLAHVGLIDTKSKLAEFTLKKKLEGLASRFHYIDGPKFLAAALEDIA